MNRAAEVVVTYAKQHDKYEEANSVEHQQLVDNAVNEELIHATVTQAQQFGSGVCSKDIFERLYDDIFNVVLPNTLWAMHRCPQRTAIVFAYMDVQQLQATKLLAIDCDGTVRMLLKGQQLGHTLTLAGNGIHTATAVSNILIVLDETRICLGRSGTENCAVEVKATEGLAVHLCVNCLANSKVVETLALEEHLE